MARLLGSTGLKTLKRMAKESSEPVVYFVVQNRSLTIRKFFMNPAGRSTRDDGYDFAARNHSIKRFLNYWHAHAYMCQLKQQRQLEEQRENSNT